MKILPLICLSFDWCISSYIRKFTLKVSLLTNSHSILGQITSLEGLTYFIFIKLSLFDQNNFNLDHVIPFGVNFASLHLHMLARVRHDKNPNTTSFLSLVLISTIGFERILLIDEISYFLKYNIKFDNPDQYSKLLR